VCRVTLPFWSVFGDDVVAEVVGLGDLGGVGVVGFDEPVQSVVLVAGDVAAGIGVGNLVAVAVEGGAGGAAQRRGGLQ
jgi:hypothetical protein